MNTQKKNKNELKDINQIGLGHFITSITIIIAVILLIFGLYEIDDHNKKLGYLLIQGSISILFCGVFFGITITSLGRLVYNSQVRTQISKKLLYNSEVRIQLSKKLLKKKKKKKK